MKWRRMCAGRATPSARNDRCAACRTISRSGSTSRGVQSGRQRSARSHSFCPPARRRRPGLSRPPSRGIQHSADVAAGLQPVDSQALTATSSISWRAAGRVAVARRQHVLAQRGVVRQPGAVACGPGGGAVPARRHARGGRSGSPQSARWRRQCAQYSNRRRSSHSNVSSVAGS